MAVTPIANFLSLLDVNIPDTVHPDVPPLKIRELFIALAESSLPDLTPQMYGAKGDGVADDTISLNDMADAAREVGCNIWSPALAAHYKISDTVDFTDISVIDFRGALIQGAISGIPAVTIGKVNKDVVNASIWLEVRNTDDKSIVPGTRGITLYQMGQSRCWFYARGFDEGVYFDGVTAVRNWVENEFNILSLYNNGTQVHFDLADASYAVHNQFRGGRYYLGTNQKAADRATIKLTLAGTSQVSEALFDSPDIGIDGESAHATHAAFVRATLGSTSNVNSIIFRNTRIEGYPTFADDIYGVLIPSATGQMSVDIDAISMSSGEFARLKVSVPDLVRQSVALKDSSNKSVSGTSQRQILTPSAFEPYQVAGRLYVPDRVLFDAAVGFGTPAQYLTTGVGTVNVALGDGRIVMSTTGHAVGHILKRTVTSVSQALFLKLLRSRVPLVVICYDAAGNVLSGSSPYYAMGSNGQATTVGAVGIYRFSTDWIWIHPDVDHFFIGECAWNGAAVMTGLGFELTYGSALRFDNRRATGPNRVAHSAAIQSFWPAGMALDGTTSNGYRGTFNLATALDAAALAAAGAVVLDDATGIAVGDRIAIELDTAIITDAEYRYHHTTVSGIGSAPTIDITDALPAGCAIGKRVLVNRWVAK